MSVGSKIRKYRNLLKLSQRELGLRSGFNENTADVRIRQYEADRMVPKADKLKEIADALEVPVEALTDHRIDYDTDFMRVLFDMEDRFGLTVDKRGDEYVLIIKNDDFMWYKENAQSELSAWYRERQKFDATKYGKSTKYTDALKEYSMWKATYPKPTDDKIAELKNSYDKKFIPLKDEVTIFRPKTVAEFIRHLELMAKAGIKMKVRLLSSNFTGPTPSIQFSYNQLMELEGEAAVLYAKFLTMMNYFDEIEIPVATRMNLYEEDMIISHLIYNGKFSFPITDLVPKMLAHAYNGTMDESPFREDYSTSLDLYAFEAVDEPNRFINLSKEQQIKVLKEDLGDQLSDEDIQRLLKHFNQKLPKLK